MGPQFYAGLKIGRLTFVTSSNENKQQNKFFWGLVFFGLKTVF
jgi:hypothetical protein